MRFAKVTPGKLLGVMDVKQGPRQYIDQYALTINEAYRGIPLDKETNVDLLKMMTLARGINNEEMQIELLRRKPATLLEAVDFLRDLEDVYDKVCGPKLAEILEESKEKMESKKVDWEIIEESEIVGRKSSPETSADMEQIQKLMQQIKLLSGKVDKTVCSTKKVKKVVKTVPKDDTAAEIA